MRHRILKLIPIVLFIWTLPSSAQLVRHQEFPTHFAHANGISIAYQDFGSPTAPTVLLIMGLGAQLIHWDDQIVLTLVDAGYRVIRFDNRDIGLSEKFLDAPTPGLFTLLRYKLGWDLNAPYHLDDMAEDAIALLDHLNIKNAHVAGVSMGGMIAQVMAAKYPDKVSSLASIMSTSGAAHLPEGSIKIEPRDRSDMSREDNIQDTVGLLQAIYVKSGIIRDAQWYARVARGYDRSHYDDGFSRQLWAVLASGDRVQLLKSIQQPTVVIHGKLDPLIPYVHGEHTADLVTNSTLVPIADMGHFIGAEHHSQIIEAILLNMRRATP